MTARALTARPPRFLLGAGSTALALALGGAPLVLSATANAAAPSGPKISICHATDSAGKPYVMPPPASAAKVLSGHGDHVGPIYALGMKDAHIVWGDIIPPFDYPATKKSPAGHYPGLNWTAAGQAILHNGCALPTTGGTTGGNPTTGGDPTTGGTGDITGGGTGATVTPVVTTPKPATKPATKPVSKPVTGGGGAVTAAKTLPFTGDRTSSLALWGFASLLGGIGFTALGGRKAQRVR